MYDSLYRQITLQKRLEELEVSHGSVQNAARVHGIDPSYWRKLKSGEKNNPSENVLKVLGLKKLVFYLVVNY